MCRQYLSFYLSAHIPPCAPWKRFRMINDKVRAEVDGRERDKKINKKLKLEKKGKKGKPPDSRSYPHYVIRIKLPVNVIQ